MKHGELDSVPVPALAGDAAARWLALNSACANYPVLLRQRRRKPPHRHGVEQRERAAAVIGVLMADDHAVQMRDACGAEHRRNDAVAGIRCFVEARPGVVEERVGMRLHEYGQALSDVEY